MYVVNYVLRSRYLHGKWRKSQLIKRGIIEPMIMHEMAHHTWPECYPVGDRQDIVRHIYISNGLNKVDEAVKFSKRVVRWRKDSISETEGRKQNVMLTDAFDPSC